MTDTGDGYCLFVWAIVPMPRNELQNVIDGPANAFEHGEHTENLAWLSFLEIDGVVVRYERSIVELGRPRFRGSMTTRDHEEEQQCEKARPNSEVHDLRCLGAGKRD